MDTYIVWDVHKNLVIRDIVDKWHERICSFMLEQHFRPHYIYNLLHIPEAEGAEEDYLAYVKHVLRNKCSIVAYDEETETIHAVGLLKWMTKEWRSWVQLSEFETKSKWRIIPKLWYAMNTEYCRENPGKTCDSLHVFEYFISEELQTDNEFMQKFFNAFCEVGRHMKMSRVTCVLLSKKEQDQLWDAGYMRTVQFIFAMYVTNENTRPFGVLRNFGEQIVWLYERQLEPLVPYYEMLTEERSSTSLKAEPTKTETPNLEVVPSHRSLHEED